MALGHAPECLAALDGHANDLHAPIEVRGCAGDVAVLDQAIDDGCEVSGGDHQALRQLSQHQSARLAVKLGQDVEARHREIEFLAEPAPQLTLDQGCAGKQPKPKPCLSPVLGLLIDPALGRNRWGLLRDCQIKSPAASGSS